MREIQYQDVVTAIKNVIIHCGTVLPDDALKAIQDAHDSEKSPVAKEVLAQLLENANIDRTILLSQLQTSCMRNTLW